MSSWSFRCLYLRFACARLSNPYLTYLLRLLTETFTTTPFERSRFRQFEASSHKAAPMDLPSSLIQHRVSQHVLDTTICDKRCHFGIRKPTKRRAFQSHVVHDRYAHLHLRQSRVNFA